VIGWFYRIVSVKFRPKKLRRDPTPPVRQGTGNGRVLVARERITAHSISIDSSPHFGGPPSALTPTQIAARPNIKPHPPDQAWSAPRPPNPAALVLALIAQAQHSALSRCLPAPRPPNPCRKDRPRRIMRCRPTSTTPLSLNHQHL
jgi:hypothetical protein